MRYFLLLVCLTSICDAETSVWRVSKGDHVLFIGGTIHLLSKDDFPLPVEFDEAFGKSSLLVFETDISRVQGPEFQQKLLHRMVYSRGRSLKDDLSPEVYQELQEYCLSRGMDIAYLDQFKPGMLVMLLSAIELQRIGMTTEGVDQYYYQKAQNNGKATGQFETVEQHLDLIEDMGKGQENRMVLSTIREMQQIESMLPELKLAWRDGDKKKIEEIALIEMRTQFPGVYQSIVVDRNNAWLPHIERLMATPETEFVLVGVLHMVGEEGVLKKLQERGYQVQAL